MIRTPASGSLASVPVTSELTDVPIEVLEELTRRGALPPERISGTVLVPVNEANRLAQEVGS